MLHARAYTSINRTPFSDGLRLRNPAGGGTVSCRLMQRGRIWRHAPDAPCRGLGGLAFSSSGLGAIHAFSFVLETELGLGHARSIAVIMPHIMEYNKIGETCRYRSIAQGLGERVEGLSDTEAADGAISCVRRMLEEPTFRTG